MSKGIMWFYLVVMTLIFMINVKLFWVIVVSLAICERFIEYRRRREE